MENTIGRRELMQMLLMGAAAARLGLSQTPRRQSLLLVTNSEGDDINVIDLERLAPAGDWKVGDRPHGIAIPAGGRVVYTTIEAENALKRLDAASGKVLATLPIGMGVDGAGYDAASGDVFLSNADGTLTIVHQDTADQYHVAQTLQTPIASRNLGLDPRSHRLFVASAKFGPAPAGGRGRGPVLPDSFSLMVIERTTAR